MQRVVLISLLCFSYATAYEKVLMISIPKCGTHLLMNAIEFLTDSDSDWPRDQFRLSQNEIDCMQSPLLAGHMLYNKTNKALIEKNNFTVFFIIRDPRDQCVSMLYWLRKHPMSSHMVKDMDDDTLLTMLITNHIELYPEVITKQNPQLSNGGSITDFYTLFLPWMAHPAVCTIRFESLVGKRGGGSQEQQLHEIDRILNHLGITKSSRFLKTIEHYLFGHSLTFRKGQIGSWRTHFSAMHKKLFKEVAGQLLIDLGYEQNLQW